jgi:dihydrolipoamide dehydrogenase
MRANVPHIFAIGDIVGLPCWHTRRCMKGLLPWTASGRAIANGRDEGVTKLLFDDSPEAHGHGKTIHPHPTLGESIGMAAEVAHGSCTDLPPSKK